MRQAGDLTAYNYKQQSEDSSAAAAFAQQQAGTDLVAGFLNVGSTLIGGAQNYLKLNPTTFSGAQTFPKTQVPGALVF